MQTFDHEAYLSLPLTRRRARYRHLNLSLRGYSYSLVMLTTGIGCFDVTGALCGSFATSFWGMLGSTSAFVCGARNQRAESGAAGRRSTDLRAKLPPGKNSNDMALPLRTPTGMERSISMLRISSAVFRCIRCISPMACILR